MGAFLTKPLSRAMKDLKPFQTIGAIRMPGTLCLPGATRFFRWTPRDCGCSCVWDSRRRRKDIRPVLARPRTLRVDSLPKGYLADCCITTTCFRGLSAPRRALAATGPRLSRSRVRLDHTEGSRNAAFSVLTCPAPAPRTSLAGSSAVDAAGPASALAVGQTGPSPCKPGASCHPPPWCARHVASSHSRPQ